MNWLRKNWRRAVINGMACLLFIGLVGAATNGHGLAQANPQDCGAVSKNADTPNKAGQGCGQNKNEQQAPTSGHDQGQTEGNSRFAKQQFGDREQEGRGHGEHEDGLIVVGLAALLVLLAFWLGRNWKNPNNRTTVFLRRMAANVQAKFPTANVTQTALEIVQTRYAKGEITREEYTTLRHDLTGETPSVPA